MKKIIFMCACVFTAGIFAEKVEKEESPLHLTFVGLSRVSQATKFDSGVSSTSTPKGTTTEFSSADFSVPIIAFLPGETWGGYIKANITILDVLTSGSGSLKTTDKATGQAVETDQGSTPMVQYQAAILGLPARIQGGALYTFFEYFALGAGVQISGIGIKQKGQKAVSDYSQVMTGELALNFQALLSIPIPDLLTVYVNPSFFVGTMGSADFLTKALYGEGGDLGKGTASGWNVMLFAKAFEHIGVFGEYGNETRVFNKSLPAGLGESRITTSYLRLGAGYVF
jgi:hypothetical protein